MRHFCFFLFLSVFFFNCGGPRGRYYAGETANDPDAITSSLFDYKERSISEADIQRILNGNIRLPDTLRIAVYQDASMPSGRYYTYWDRYDENRLQTQQAMLDSFSTALRRSGRVSKVIAMPSLLVGTKPSINQLRESAVRLQADALLVFALKSDLYARYKAFKKSDAKAYATCQAILMDVRTGVIPHSDVLTRDFYGQVEPADLNSDDMRRRVQQQAAMMAVGAAGRSMERFLRE
jgi:hypothetical protein